MDLLPKSARDRLRANPPAEHPDADLLTAFAERSLSERERLQIADHLARCAECRQVVAVAVPEFEPAFVDPATAAVHARVAGVPLPVPAAAKMSTAKRTTWLRSPVLRWSALAACIVVVGAAVLNYRKSSRMESYAPAASRDADAEVMAKQEKTEHAPELREYAKLDDLKAESKPKVQQPPGLADKAASSKSGRAAAKLEGRGRFDQMAGSKKAPQSEMVTVETGRNAPVTQSATSANEAPAASRERAAAPPPVPAERAQGTKDEIVGGSAGKQSLEVSAAAAPVESQTAGYLQKGKLGSEKENNMKAAVARPSPDFANRIAEAAANEGLVGQRPAKWSLTNEGLPQRSFDSGATWEEIAVDHSGGFRALSVVGQDVWVGGATGLLYHSADSGLHWIRVVPSAGGGQLQADISRIEFTDALHGRVTTADGANWTTSDGGKTWQKN